MQSHVSARFLAPRFSKSAIAMLVLVYLTMTAALLLLNAKPFGSAIAYDIGIASPSVSPSTQSRSVEILEVKIPSAPQLILGPANYSDYRYFVLEAYLDQEPTS